MIPHCIANVALRILANMVPGITSMYRAILDAISNKSALDFMSHINVLDKMSKSNGKFVYSAVSSL